MEGVELVDLVDVEKRWKRRVGQRSDTLIFNTLQFHILVIAASLPLHVFLIAIFAFLVKREKEKKRKTSTNTISRRENAS